MGKNTKQFQREQRRKLTKMQTSLDGDNRNRNGSKYTQVVPGLGWIHKGTKKWWAVGGEGARI